MHANEKINNKNYVNWKKPKQQETTINSLKLPQEM